MQIPSGTIPHGVSKAPPPAMVQTPIGEGVKLPESMDHTHSRNSSHSSTATAPPAPAAPLSSSAAATTNSTAALGKATSAVAIEDPKVAGKT